MTEISELEPSLLKLRGASQLTLPRELRNAIHLEEGDYLEASLTDEGILLRPVTIQRRFPSPDDEALISSVVNDVRKEYAEERRNH